MRSACGVGNMDDPKHLEVCLACNGAAWREYREAKRAERRARRGKRPYALPLPPTVRR